MLFDTVTGRQLLRYAMVGAMSNLFLYAVYLLITHKGMGYKTAMSLLYMLGVCMTFVFNKNWTFTHQGQVTKSFLSYVSIYALGYLVNLLALFILVDQFEFRHQWVQGIMIILLAIFLFILQKYFVFKKL